MQQVQLATSKLCTFYVSRVSWGRLTSLKFQIGKRRVQPKYPRLSAVPDNLRGGEQSYHHSNSSRCYNIEKYTSVAPINFQYVLMCSSFNFLRPKISLGTSFGSSFQSSFSVWIFGQKGRIHLTNSAKDIRFTGSENSMTKSFNLNPTCL